jgi:GMP synthase-like glutamine amidotransferase
MAMMERSQTQASSGGEGAAQVTGARRLWVIDPSLYVAEEQGVENITRHWCGPWRLLRPAMRPDDAAALDPSQGYAEVGAVVVMGSAASVHDRAPWLDALKAWVGPILAGEVAAPLLGICFGHQLIGQLAGGQVGYLNPDQTKRVGVEYSEARGDNRLLADGERLRVIVSHREHVAMPPPDALYAVVATRPGVPVDGLQHRHLPIFGVQYHPEARDVFAARVGISPEAVDPQLDRDGHRLLGAFLAAAARP